MSTTVFISSTSRDLLDHRAAVAKALLNAGFHPIDMANFMARPEGAKTACLKEVAEADLFVSIYAWRYGFIPPEAEVSITEQEFLEAERLKKSCFIFMVDETHPWPEELKEGGLPGRLLREFKARLDLKLVRTTFTTPDDLAMKVLASLQRYEREHPRLDPGAEVTPAPPAVPSTQMGGVNFSGISGNTLNVGNISANVTAGGDMVGGSKRVINTDGGAYIEGTVNTGGGDFVGRDRITTGATLEAITAAFAGLYQALEAKPRLAAKEAGPTSRRDPGVGSSQGATGRGKEGPGRLRGYPGHAARHRRSGDADLPQSHPGGQRSLSEDCPKGSREVVGVTCEVNGCIMLLVALLSGLILPSLLRFYSGLTPSRP